jgi:Cytochrome c554 and c-prime
MKSAWVFLLGLGAAAGAGAASGCSTATPTTFLSREEMLQPIKCAPCHVRHFDDWTESMHAKAADDPVFIAMNKRGQRETGGKLGTFCVKCHAPMAVRDGKTTDGLNLASLPTYYKGVTCFFCHSINSVGESHNNASVNLATDLVMRGELTNPPPVANSAHGSAYSTFHDDQQKDSATMCGSCHDIDSPAGGHIERTFAEWSASAFSGPKGSTCTFTACHIREVPGQIPIATGGPERKFHPHDFPAVDVSLETSTSNVDGGDLADGGAATAEGGGPIASSALPATTNVQNALNSDALQGALCVTVNSGIRVILDTTNIGHQWPSGAAQDRRAWAEVIAYGADGGMIYSSGVVPDGTPVTSIQDPDLWLLRDCMFDAESRPVVNFWEAASTNGYELPALLTNNRLDPNFYANHIVQSFPRTASGQLTARPARVTLRMRIQPVGLDVLQDLVQSGDLDPTVVAKMPTFDVSLQGPIGPGLAPPGGLEWTPASNDAPYTDNTNFQQGPATCAASPGFNPGLPVSAHNAAICKAP